MYYLSSTSIKDPYTIIIGTPGWVSYSKCSSWDS